MRALLLSVALCLLGLFGAASCSRAPPTEAEHLVRRLTALGPSDHLSYQETGGNDRVIHFYAEAGAATEILSLGPLREPKPRLTADLRGAFFLVDDGHDSNGVDDLYYLDGDRGELRRIRGTSSFYAVSPTGEFLLYLDTAYAMGEEDKGNLQGVRMVLYSVLEAKVVSDHYATGDLFIYDTASGPAITFDETGPRFLFRILQPDAHIASYETVVPSGTFSLLSVSKETFAAP